MYFLWYLLIGLVAGWLASLVVKGNGSGLVMNLVLGVIGGLLGGWILSWFGVLAWHLRQPRGRARRCGGAVVDRRRHQQKKTQHSECES